MKAADQGNASAQYNLGWMHEFGRTLPKDPAKAAEWYEKAVAQGHNSAQYNLGLLYAHGEGVPRDDTKAASLFRMAAKQGNTSAQSSLGMMLVEELIPSDDTAAFMWLELAASGFSPTEAEWRNNASYRDKVAARMTPDQIAEAKRLVRDWLPKA
jgi:hypothetical protein